MTLYDSDGSKYRSQDREAPNAFLYSHFNQKHKPETSSVVEDARTRVTHF